MTYHGMQGLHWQLLEQPGGVVTWRDVVGTGVVVVVVVVGCGVVVVVVVVGAGVGWGLHGGGQPHGEQGHLFQKENLNIYKLIRILM